MSDALAKESWVSVEEVAPQTVAAQLEAAQPRAFVVVELREPNEEQLRKSVSIVRRSLHELQGYAGVVLADLPYYQHHGPKVQGPNGPPRYLTNHWSELRALFEEMRHE